MAAYHAAGDGEAELARCFDGGSHLCHDRTMAMSTAAAILAGGRARRFGGRDKSRLVIEGRPIIVRQLEVLRRIAGEVFVVAREADRFADLAVPVHRDRFANLGAIGGLYTALDAAQADLVLVVACDLPFLNEALLNELVARATTADGAWVRTAHGPQPLLACYQRRARARVLAQIDAGRLKARELEAVLQMTAVTEEELARYGPTDELVANLNTPEDYARVQYRPR